MATRRTRVRRLRPKGSRARREISLALRGEVPPDRQSGGRRKLARKSRRVYGIPARAAHRLHPGVQTKGGRTEQVGKETLTNRSFCFPFGLSWNPLRTGKGTEEEDCCTPCFDSQKKIIIIIIISVTGSASRAKPSTARRRHSWGFGLQAQSPLTMKEAGDWKRPFFFLSRRFPFWSFRKDKCATNMRRHLIVVSKLFSHFSK